MLHSDPPVSGESLCKQTARYKTIDGGHHINCPHLGYLRHSNSMPVLGERMPALLTGRGLFSTPKQGGTERQMRIPLVIIHSVRARFGTC